MFELFRESLFAAWAVVVFKIECDELRPRKVCLGLRWVLIRFQVGDVELR